MSWVILFLMCPIKHGQCVKAQHQPIAHYSSHDRCEREKYHVAYGHAIQRGWQLIRVCEEIRLEHAPVTT